jgi:hypothetical protein
MCEDFGEGGLIPRVLSHYTREESETIRSAREDSVVHVGHDVNRMVAMNG